MHRRSPLIPRGASAPAGLRAFRVAWVDALRRGPGHEPVLGAGFVAQHARVLSVIDVRPPEEQGGPVGRIPGSYAVEAARAVEACAALDRDDPLVVVDGNDERAPAVARFLETAGFRLVAHLRGGLREWRAHGFGVTREPAEAVARVPRADHRFDAARRALGLEDVREHLGNPRTLHRQKLAAVITRGHLSCVDGRDHGAVLGTPGGDAGELLLALTALEAVRGRALAEPEVERVLEHRLDAFGPCALHTDFSSLDRASAAVRAHPTLAGWVEGLREPLEWRAFWKRPPPEARGALLELATLPEHLGCGHLRLALTRAADYGARPALVQAMLRAFFRFRWSGSEETWFAPLPGGHAEGAVLRVRVPEPVGAFTFVPLVSPLCHGTQLFVVHPEVAAALRRLTGRWLVERGLLPGRDEQAWLGAVQALAARQLEQTLVALAPGLPIYDLWLPEGGEARVEAAGVAPGVAGAG